MKHPVCYPALGEGGMGKKDWKESEEGNRRARKKKGGGELGCYSLYNRPLPRKKFSKAFTDFL